MFEFFKSEVMKHVERRIVNLESSVSALEDKVFEKKQELKKLEETRKDQIKTMVVDAIEEALQPPRQPGDFPDYSTMFLDEKMYMKINGSFHDILESVVGIKAEKAAGFVMHQRVDNEEFIDSVVKRINQKQVGAK